MTKKPVMLPKSPLRTKATLEMLLGREVTEDTQVAEGIEAAHVIQVIEDAQDTQAVQDVPGVQDVHDTQAAIRRRKQKSPRINMAFEGDNLDYLRLISRLDDVSITAYVNNLIAKDMTARAHDVVRARRVLK